MRICATLLCAVAVACSDDGQDTTLAPDAAAVGGHSGVVGAGGSSVTLGGSGGASGSNDAGTASDADGAPTTSDAAAGGAAGGGGADAATAPCSLTASGPVTVTTNGQIIELLRITSTNGPGISVDGHSGVVIRNVEIRHAGGHGIDIARSDDILIENVSIEHTGAPASGQNPNADLDNIYCNGSARPTIKNVRLTRGSSGIYLVECPNSQLSFVEGHDFRGPFPRGQVVQWDKSDHGTLEDFSVECGATSWTEDNVNMYMSLDMAVRRGLVDGNNSPSGVGVIFDGDTSTGVVEDVDAVHMGNGCFSDYAGADGNVFRRTRCRDNICTSQQGRGVPSSNALLWAGHPGYTAIRIEQSTYFAACNPGNIVWPAESFAIAKLTNADFTPRSPLRLGFCWQ
jgi:hypothetical protein